MGLSSDHKTLGVFSTDRVLFHTNGTHVNINVLFDLSLTSGEVRVVLYAPSASPYGIKGSYDYGCLIIHMTTTSEYGQAAPPADNPTELYGVMGDRYEPATPATAHFMAITQQGALRFGGGDTTLALYINPYATIEYSIAG